MEKKRYHIFVEGMVQGVFLRAWAKKQADMLEIKGWAKNLPDGRVEIIAEGSAGAVEQFLKLLERGPEMAHIENIESKAETPTEEFRGFEIIP